MAVDRRIGTELGGYRIEEQIGRGGMSVVYRAEHVRLGRPAALKLLVPGFGESDFTGRFLRESQLAASLDHPSIVPVYDAGEEDGLLYIAMALIAGSDLRTLLAAEGPLPLRRALRIVGQIAAALDTAHARGLVHRDVKPANILVGDDDRAWLTDFGTVKELAGNGMTRTGSFVGTIEYSAPEQIEGREVGPRTDVYALACVLYECLAGEAPFHRDSEVAVLNAHLKAAPPRLGKTAPDLPDGLDDVLAKALSKSPLDRYASCGELVAAARGTTVEPRVHRRRLAVSVALLVLAALAGAAAALGIRALVNDSPTAAPPVTTTVITTAPGPPSLDVMLMRSKDGETLNNAAFFLIGAHQYARAIPLERRAIRFIKANTKTYGYARFNLGLALLKTARCRAALPFLQRALQLEAADQARYIQPRITEAQKCA